MAVKGACREIGRQREKWGAGANMDVVDSECMCCLDEPREHLRFSSAIELGWRGVRRDVVWLSFPVTRKGNACPHPLRRNERCVHCSAVRDGPGKQGASSRHWPNLPLQSSKICIH